MFHTHQDNSITMDFSTNDLVEILQENRDKHAKDLENAISGYHKAVKAVTEKNIKELQARLADPKHKPSWNQEPNKPRGFLEKYDRMISMLRATTNETLPLTSAQYECYAMDQWGADQQTFAMTSGSLTAYYSP